MVKSCFQKPFQNSWLGAATHTLQVQASLCNCIIRGEYYISPDPFIPHSFRAWPFSSSHTRATAARRTALETGAVTERGPSRANPIRVALTQHFQTGPRTHACGEKDKKKKIVQPSSKSQMTECAPQEDATWRGGGTWPRQSISTR